MTINILSGIAIPQYRLRGKELVGVRCARMRGASSSGPSVHNIGPGSAVSSVPQGIVPCLGNRRSYRTPNGFEAMPARFSPAIERSHAVSVNRVSTGRGAKAALPGISPLAPAVGVLIHDGDFVGGGSLGGVHIFFNFKIVRRAGRRGGSAWLSWHRSASQGHHRHSGAAVVANGARIIHRKQLAADTRRAAPDGAMLCLAPRLFFATATRGRQVSTVYRTAAPDLGRDPKRCGARGRCSTSLTTAAQSRRRDSSPRRPGGSISMRPASIRGAVLRQRRIRGAVSSSYRPSPIIAADERPRRARRLTGGRRRPSRRSPIFN